MTASPRVRVAVYLLLTFAFSNIFYVLCARYGMKALYVYGLMWCPGVSALLVTFVTDRKFKEFGWRLGHVKYLLAGWWVPMAYAWPAYLLVWTTGLGGFPKDQLLNKVSGLMHLSGSSRPTTLFLLYAATATVGVLVSCLSAAGEEIGWRGFLVPELMKFNSFTATALISGIIWSLWHVPLILWSNYNSGTPAWYGISCFAIMVISISFLFAWLRMRSGSLWPAVLLHAAHNAIIQSYLDALTVNRGHTNWFIGEFGCALLPFVIFAAWVVWRWRGEVERGVVR
jgi:membrane protease YdiL (CAAX protease family)